MLYHLLYPLRDLFFGFNIFKYITFRSIFAFIMSFLIVILLGKVFIKYLKRMRISEYIDMYGHLKLEKIYNGKKGTPTMGGILIILSIAVSIVLWCRLDNLFVWLCLAVLVWFGFFGFVDDYLKHKRSEGLTRLPKLFIQIIIGAAIGAVLLKYDPISPKVYIPFLKNAFFNLGFFYILWTALVVSATCNSVNFTDGIDGLASGSIVMVSVVFAIFSYISGHVEFSKYLFLPFIQGAGELSVVCCALGGAALGFLWFNTQPAEVFMGDIGSSALGGVLGTVALFTKKELWLVIAGGLFVLEAISVILQIASVKIRNKKIFKAAPFHHHLQLSGWPESKVTVRLWIIASLFAAFALVSLKIM